MLNKKILLTPMALALAMSFGAAQAAEPGNGQVAGAVDRVTDALKVDAARDADGAESAGLPIEGLGSRDRDNDGAESLGQDDDNGSLRGLATADRNSLRADADDRRTNDPQGAKVDLSLGNTSDSPDARAPGVRVSNDSTLHLRTEEDSDSPLDNGDETARSGLESKTGVHVIRSRENDDGDRERVANGIETGASTFGHAPHDDSDADRYSTAEVSGFATERRVEDGVINEDEEESRRGGTVRYDSREGVSFEGGDDEDR